MHQNCKIVQSEKSIVWKTKVTEKWRQNWNNLLFQMWFCMCTYFIWDCKVENLKQHMEIVSAGNVCKLEKYNSADKWSFYMKAVQTKLEIRFEMEWI